MLRAQAAEVGLEMQGRIQLQMPEHMARKMVLGWESDMQGSTTALVVPVRWVDRDIPCANLNRMIFSTIWWHNAKGLPLSQESHSKKRF